MQRIITTNDRVLQSLRGFNRYKESMANYLKIIRRMKGEYGVRIHRWRKAMTGSAWRVNFSDGRSIRWIQSPFPKTPISLAIFLHEVGHHVVGFDRFTIPSEEEYHVWLWALGKMEEVGVPADESVFKRFERSMQYAVGKDIRRGKTNLPASLKRFS
jgi:hypothetical protein